MSSNGFNEKSLLLIEKANVIIRQYPEKLTLRQIFYRLVASQEIENTKSSYTGLSNKLARAREQGLIDPDAIEDRVRRIDGIVQAWDNPSEYMDELRLRVFEDAGHFTRDIWATNNKYVEAWTEKDALSSVLSRATSPYRVPLVVCRGYISLTALLQAIERFSKNADGRESIILYFGDFDPSGEDMVRDIRKRLNDLFPIFGNPSCMPTVKKVALSKEDIFHYGLPHDYAKKTDTRTKDFIKEHGDICTELDALPPDVLVDRVEESISALIDDTESWNELLSRENDEKQEILASLKSLWGE